MKRDGNGSLKPFQERFVARDNFQTSCVDYAKVYAPIYCIAAIIILISLDTWKGWCSHRLDIEGAFLYTGLVETEEEI